MEEIVKHINDTNASYRTLNAGDAKNTDLFLDNEHFELFKEAGDSVTVRFKKENLQKAILFIASILPRKYDNSSTHKSIPFSTSFVLDQLAFLDAFFTLEGKSVETRTQVWNARKDIQKKNGDIDSRFYFNGLLEDVSYKSIDGNIKTAKFTIRNYVAGGYSDLHIKKAVDGIFDVWVTNALEPYYDKKEQGLEDIYRDSNQLQQIYYGAPGTGKSHKIKEQTQGDDTVIRTTFHPDSDYSTFVGCYKPTKESTSTLSLHKLHSIYPDFKSKASDRPLHRFIAKYHDSFRLLTAKEAELVFDKYETPSTISAEIPKIMSAIEEIPSTQTITYSFVKQAFTKAYIQAWEKMCRTTPSATPTATIPAGSATSPYSKTGKLGANSTFKYDPQGATLSEDEMDKLNEVDNFDFPFEGIDNFAELHNSGITVVVTDKPQEDDERYHKKIKFTAKDIRELYALWENDKKRYWFLGEQGLLRIIYDKLKKEKKLKEDSGEILVTDPLVKLKDYTGESVTIEINESNTLLGKYVSNTKTVYLYKDNIRIWGHGEELELLCAVYVHEMFHAYFDMVPHQTISEIEEPIVECSTLCFLELFDSAICNVYLDHHVRRKQQSSAICYYGFGAYLYENRSLDWMKLYQNGFGKIIANSPIVEQYKNKFFPAYRFAEEQSTMDILYSILNPQSKAVFDKSDQFLIIEEINRGNCAQIFGDLFQLLDRNENGYSEYPIVPDDDLKNVLAEDFAGLTLGADVKSRIDAIFKENYPAGIADKILSGELLVLPENLYIWATMNTSDQSLFPIDSAFKRRWDWEYLPIGYKNSHWTIKIGEKEYNWTDFQRKVNEKIYGVDNSEDKQLGDFFVNADRTGNVISADTLLNKILFYIWNDVCKDDPDQIFRWIDDKKEEKSIKFSEFFAADKDTKLQGFMEFLEVPERGKPAVAGGSEDAEKPAEAEGEVTSAEEETAPAEEETTPAEEETL